MKMICNALIIGLFTLVAFSAQAASIKKWTDENGRVYYGDSPPRSAQVKIINTNNRPSNIGKPLPRLSTKSNSDNKQKSGSKTPTVSTKQQIKEACAAAKKDFAVIKNSSRLQLRSADGSVRYMTNDEIADRLERSNREIKQYCK